VRRSGAGAAAAGLAATLILLAPALWNGFPLLEYDTGGYFARWFEGTLEVSRSTVYGLFLVVLAQPNLWPALLLQAAATVWIIGLVLRLHGLPGRPLVLLGAVAALSLTTALPFLVSTLLTDIFAGLGMLALCLLVLHGGKVAAWERAVLMALTAFAAATHNATLAVLSGLLLAGGIAALFSPAVVPIRGLARGAAALVTGAVLLVCANYVVAGRLAWTPGGVALTFGRMLQDGIVSRYLADHCPDPRLRLCQHRAELPTDADVFFWGESVFDRLGRFEGLDREMRTIVLASLAAYPRWQAEAAARAMVRQLVALRTGEGVNDQTWHSYNMIERFAPSMLPAMRAARQQRGELDFLALNRVHVPVAMASILLLLVIAGLAATRACPAELGMLAGTVFLGMVGNAAVCGIFANPHDRYGARLAWAATAVVVVAGINLARSGVRRGRLAAG
jgi:hypothetical protein